MKKTARVVMIVMVTMLLSSIAFASYVSPPVVSPPCDKVKDAFEACGTASSQCAQPIMDATPKGQKYPPEIQICYSDYKSCVDQLKMLCYMQESTTNCPTDVMPTPPCPEATNVAQACISQKKLCDAAIPLVAEAEKANEAKAKCLTQMNVCYHEAAKICTCSETSSPGSTNSVTPPPTSPTPARQPFFWKFSR